MPDDTTPATAQPPAPPARPPAAPAAAAPVPSAEPGEGLTDAEEAELARLQAKAAAAAAGPGAVRMRISGGGHSQMTYGGYTLTQEFQPVPPHLTGPLATAASDAGVEIEQES